MRAGRARTDSWRRCKVPPANRLLNDVRIVVTRRPDQAAEFCAALEALGAKPIAVPAIRCIPLSSAEIDAACHQLATYDWVLLTSPNAVRVFLAELLPDRLADGSTVPRLAAIGPKTAESIEELGYPVAVQPAHATGVDLAQALGDLDGKRVLLPRSRRGRPEIIAALTQQGARATDLAIYDTVDAVPTPSMIQALACGVDVVTFTSPSTVQSFARHVDPTLWTRATIACIGPTTAAAAQELGLSVGIVPDEYTVAGLVNAIRAHFSRKGLNHATNA